MLHIMYITLTPVIQIITILAFLAAIVLVLRIIAKMFPKTVATLKAKTPWMGWNYDEAEDQYTNFVIHPSNYIKVPSR